MRGCLFLLNAYEGIFIFNECCIYLVTITFRDSQKSKITLSSNFSKRTFFHKCIKCFNSFILFYPYQEIHSCCFYFQCYSNYELNNKLSFDILYANSIKKYNLIQVILTLLMEKYTVVILHIYLLTITDFFDFQSSMKTLPLY